MKNIGNLMKQAQKLQSKMMAIQEELAERTVTAQVGGGMVEVVANGRQELVSVRIDPEVVNPDDVEMLQDLVLAAVNDALNRAREMVSEEMSKLTGGLKIPGLM
ncbi:MAG: YbaB/EbfC family nucleoid-associated protein [Desulfobacteraceae bacterium]